MRFQTKVACEQAAAKWRAKFETEVKEGTNRSTERRRRLARAVPSIKCVESTEIPPALSFKASSRLAELKFVLAPESSRMCRGYENSAC